MCRTMHGLCGIHTSTYSLQEPERQQVTVSSPGGSVFIISLLQQILTAFVAFLIISNPSTAMPQEREREVTKSKMTAHMIFHNKQKGEENILRTLKAASQAQPANKAMLVWGHNRHPWSILCGSESSHVILSQTTVYLCNAPACTSFSISHAPKTAFAPLQASVHLMAKMLYTTNCPWQK